LVPSGHLPPTSSARLPYPINWLDIADLLTRRFVPGFAQRRRFCHAHGMKPPYYGSSERYSSLSCDLANKSNAAQRIGYSAAIGTDNARMSRQLPGVRNNAAMCNAARMHRDKTLREPRNHDHSAVTRMLPGWFEQIPWFCEDVCAQGSKLSMPLLQSGWTTGKSLV
jgi:hypothetical protein